MIDLSIVIVSWNVKSLLKKCLESIKRNQDNLKLEVFVIDNASTDGTVEMAKEDFVSTKKTLIEFVANKTNVGFAVASNQGILRSAGRYVLLLNPDTEILNNALKKAVDFLDQNPRAGVLGCRHLNPDWTLQPSVRRLPKLWPIILILTKLAKIIPNLKSLNYYLAKDFDYKINQPAAQVAGSFFMVRRETSEEIGILDENFFIWFEEVDFCQRALEASWQIWYNRDAEIIHYGGQSFAQVMSWKKQLMFCKSAIHYFQKHGFFH